MTEDTSPNSDMEQEWITLFDGTDLDAWKSYNSDSITHWHIQGDAMVLTPQEGESENLITRSEFTDFILSLEWKISEGGNSGIMWGVKEVDSLSEPYFTGPEIQILDNERHPDGKAGPEKHANALFDMSPPTQDVTKPAGQWNKVIIKIDHKDNVGEVSMNGTLINQFPVEGEGWKKMVENSKFKDWPHFGKYNTGHIALQDHHNIVSFRNIRIKRLNTAQLSNNK